MRFSEQLQQKVEPIIEEIYNDGFIQGFVNDDISAEAVSII